MNKLILSILIFLLSFSSITKAQSPYLSQDQMIERILKPKTLWDREALHFVGGLILGYGYYEFMKTDHKKWYHWVIGGAVVGTLGYITYKETVLDIRNNTTSPNIFVKLDNSGDYTWGNYNIIDQNTKSFVDLGFWYSGAMIGSLIPYMFKLKSENDSLKNINVQK